MSWLWPPAWVSVILRTRVPAIFAAGVLTAWSAIYFVCVGFCLWFWKRSRDVDLIPLTGLALLMALTCLFGAGGLAEIRTAASHRLTEMTAVLIPMAFLHVALASEVSRSAFAKKAIIGGHALGAIAAILALSGVFSDGEPPFPSIVSSPNLFGRGLIGLMGFATLGATYVESVNFVKKTSAAPRFAGAVLLGVGFLHDAITLSFGQAPIPLLPIGFGGFVLGVFAAKLRALAERRDELTHRTEDLSRRSSDLTKAYRKLRAAQSELVRKQQLAAIGELSAVVAHEVRNPLAVIQNAVANLRRNEVKEEDRDVLLGILGEETSRLNRIVDDLLEYAKPLAFAPEKVGVREIVDRAVVRFSAAPNLLVTIQEPVRVGLVAADHVLLRQAIDNLLGNAAQAMSNGGELSIALRPHRRDGREFVEIVVSDTGEGMDTVVRDRALDPFFTTRPTGTGLGLAVVARVVEAHRGHLTIESERNIGTRITMALPVDIDAALSRRSADAILTAAESLRASGAVRVGRLSEPPTDSEREPLQSERESLPDSTSDAPPGRVAGNQP